MEAANHSKNSVSRTENHVKHRVKSKNFVFIVLFTALFGIIIGCNDDKDDSLDNTLIGKWEMQSYIINNVKFDLPLPEIGIDTYGIEFGVNTVKHFRNGNLISEERREKELGLNMFLSQTQVTDDNYKVDGNTLTVWLNSSSSYSNNEQLIFRKVSKFSWE